MAETAILAALNVLGDAMASELVNRLFSQSSKIRSSNLEASMNNITRELRLMQEFIDYTNIHDQSNENQVIWINEVRKLANEIEDTAAEFVYLVGNRKIGGKSFCMKMFFKDPKSLIALDRVVSQLLEAERSINDLANSRGRWMPTPNYDRKSQNSNLSNELSHNIIAASAHFIDEDNIVGNKENKAKLTNWLNSEEQQLSIISVWGMGGVGKTTLVVNVFKREKQHFHCNAWITISQNYNVENILRSLISKICKKEQIAPMDATNLGQNAPIDTTNMDIRELIECTSNLLKDKSYLIVLDDIWDPIAFQDIRDALVDNHKGSRIIITSRHQYVASLAPESNRLQLKPLLENESWELFCKKAFPFETDHKCPSNLEMWAREIVVKCDGLPLALVSLGSLSSLYEKTESEWKRIHDQLSWELDNNPNLSRLKNILYLSFNYLPRYLKNCFLYCGLFPEDSRLARKKLIRLWIAEGFVELKGRCTLEEVAEGYIMELIHRSMLQVVERNKYGRVKRCQMHDTLRELAISLCRKENFGLLHDENNPANFDTSTRRLSIIQLSEHTRHDVCLPQLKTFMSFDHTEPSSPLLSSIFDKSRYLTVLELGGLPIATIPDAIGDLFNIHYLGLRETKVKFLPKSIKKLHNLQTLDLYNSQIQKLPDGIKDLKNLRHLFAQVLVDSTYRSFRCLTGIHLSKGMLYLIDLQTLQAVESSTLVVRELGNLTQLRSFRIVNVEENHSTELCRSLSKMRSLSHLSIHASNENEILHLEGLKLPQIRKLEISGRLKEKILESPLFQISGEGIQMLWLVWSQLQNDCLPSLSNCKNLTYLCLQRAYEGHQLTFQAGWFPKLKYLLLRQMPNLVQVEMEQGTMASLEEIYLWELKQLVDIPKGIEHLASLKRMACEDMPAEFGGLANEAQQLFHFTCYVR